MRYKTRKEYFENRLYEIVPEMAELLDNGHQIEVCRSRSGIKIYSISKKHHVIKKGGNAGD